MALAEARLNGLEQYQVAGRAGVDPATLSRILNRKREPTLDQARAIASALNRSVEELFPDLGEVVA